MRKCFKSFFEFLSRLVAAEEGQAVVEYILMVAFALSVVALITNSFRKSVMRLWVFYIRQVSAACPGCEANPIYRY